MPVDAGTPPEALTEAGRDSLVEYVTDAIATTFDDTVYQATDFPGFVADTNPVGPFANVSRQVARLACRSYARGRGPTNLPGFDAVWGGICKPYLEDIGEDPSGGALGRPFSGGQCSGVLYAVTFKYNLIATDGSTIEPAVTATSNAIGPIGGIRGQGSPEFQNIVIDSGVGPDFARTGSCVQGCYRNISIVSVARVDGLPDSCGSPPPLYDPPKKRPGLPVVPTTPIDFPGIGPIGVNIDFNPDGTINVKLPDVGVDIDVPVDFGDDGGGGGDDGGGGGPSVPAPGDDGQPGGGQTAGPGQDAQGEAPPGSVLVGLKMNMTTIPPKANQYMPGAYRGAAYIYMGGNAGLDQDFAGSVLANGQFVYAEKDNLTKWKVRANNDFVFNVVPYYREVSQ